MPRPRDSKIVLAGREFTAVGPWPLRQDHWLMTRLREACLSMVEKRPDEDTRAYGERVLDELLRSENGFECMGGLLVPAEAEAWSPAVARETAAFVGGLTAPEDKQQVNVLFVSLLIPFLMRELASLTSSARPSGAAPGARADRPGSARSTANGAASSGYSPGMT